MNDINHPTIRKIGRRRLYPNKPITTATIIIIGLKRVLMMRSGMVASFMSWGI